MDALTQWLLKGPAWVQYRARLDLLRQSEKTSDVRQARRALLADPQVQGLLDELAKWPGETLTNHKSAGHLLHKLVFVADLGLRSDDPGVDKVIQRILQHQSAKGPFQVRMNIPTHFGGTGKDEWSWALCDAPLVVYALVKFGLSGDPRVKSAVHHLADLVRENGWPCAVSPELGKFRGPGRKDDPCPFATLVMLQVLAQLPAWRNSQASRAGVESLLNLWKNSRAQHPYLFYMGDDFGKLKAPLVWYDLLHVLDVLTQYPWARQDARLHSMVTRLQVKADREGRFTTESIWTSWKDWEFGQKKTHSMWVTLLAHRILARVEA